LRLRTVGIDIGTTTSHLIFSELELERQGIRLSSAYVVVERKVAHRSDVILTPYASERRIDTDALAKFIERSYAEAGWKPDDVDTGAVITTGEAARKENASAIVQLFSGQAGKFVCATAGHHLESLLAAHGSGADRLAGYRHALRDALDTLPQLDDDDFLLSKQVNFETIHVHDVVAERFGTVGELRDELATGRPTPEQTTLAAWLTS